ncbi:Anionic cell wall polymer biosynthesis enzyme, LytR-Cps2A-Psr (LCP) family [Brevibacterium sandarakinum]|uniref:Anionic cell wall polymer biosynthesis enzyme, LytR-Cps2A-Psr (LCP) family n=1 Tax=Brevibacterium sandarakinum TaxID=629680 RepID=A0A1H1PRA7_BRESA|nr:LCP family protein [Brevibacterium sandarakinum]SDS13567.1 Anionic cell wall polymer biosynthesis enzyme, LytR-Cps2A-Psr (LCP) family [Brevibacterium sandarakinum]
MAKLKKLVSAVGSIKDLGSARAEFDDSARILPDAEIYPPEDIRPEATDARTLLLRVTTPDGQQTRASQGDTFAVIHIPASSDFAAVLTINPSTQIESGQTFAALADDGGWPVIVAIAEEFLGIRIDHVAELEVSALGNVVDELGSLPVYSRTAFSSGQTEFIEGTNNLDSSTTGIFTSADPVDDAGQTRTRNQRAVLRALFQALKSGGLAKDPNKGAEVLGQFASGIHHDADLTTLELGKLANSLRQLQNDDIAVVTVPTNSRRDEGGTVTVDFDPEAMPALKDALAGNDLPEFFRYLVSLGY